MCKHVHFLSVATLSTPEKVKEPLSRSFLFIYYISNPFYQWLLERGYKHLSFCPSFRPVCHRAVVSSWTNLLENIYTVVCSIISSTNRYFILFRPVCFENCEFWTVKCQLSILLFVSFHFLSINFRYSIHLFATKIE